jgi:hypothetical protein
MMPQVYERVGEFRPDALDETIQEVNAARLNRQRTWVATCGDYHGWLYSMAQQRYDNAVALHNILVGLGYPCRFERVWGC